jgi:hypothetical protein
MNDANRELEALRGEVAELKAQVSHDNQNRRELFAATDRLLPALGKQQEQWDRLHTAHLEALRHSPELERLREEGLLPRMAVLMTRQTTLEREFHELCGVAIETFTIVRELLERLKPGVE